MPFLHSSDKMLKYIYVCCVIHLFAERRKDQQADEQAKRQHEKDMAWRKSLEGVLPVLLLLSFVFLYAFLKQNIL